MSLAPTAPASTSPPDDAAFDGDPFWRVTRVLRDGTTITIRPVTPEDREELRRGLAQLSPETRYLRFMHLGAAPTDELLTYLTTVDQKDHVAIGATIESPDLKSERGIGVARFVRLRGMPDTAEAAVTVVDDMQRRGVGAALLRELLRAARARGIETIRAEVLADNTLMRTILERAGAREVRSESGAGTIAYDLSIAGENAHDGEHRSVFDVLRGFAEAMAAGLRR